MMVYFSIFLVLVVWLFLKFTRGGLILRAVGENHEAAHALGYKVIRIRILAIMFGGSCAGMGGAYLSLVRVPQWTEGMTAGAGWIALAIVVLPVGSLGGLYWVPICLAGSQFYSLIYKQMDLICLFLIFLWLRIL